MYNLPTFTGKNGTVKERKSLIENALGVVQLLCEHGADESAMKILDLCAYVAHINGETLTVWTVQPPTEE